jgi:hypothetical protein
MKNFALAISMGLAAATVSQKMVDSIDFAASLFKPKLAWTKIESKFLNDIETNENSYTNLVEEVIDDEMEIADDSVHSTTLKPITDEMLPALVTMLNG